MQQSDIIKEKNEEVRGVDAVRVPRPSRRKAVDRRSITLQTLARLLNNPKCENITTALLAKEMNVSEAALYRCFSGKAAIYEGLIDFIEEALMTLYANVRSSETMSATTQVRAMMMVTIDFIVRNPGLTRVLAGQVLFTEKPELQARINRIFSSIEMKFRLTLKDAVAAQKLPADFNTTQRARIITAYIAGAASRFVNTEFKEVPDNSSGVYELFIKP